MMRLLVKQIAIVALILMHGYVYAQEHVNGYYRANGGYVQPYYRSQPDGSSYNNYSTRGNSNPFTGEASSDSPEREHRTSPFYGSSNTDALGLSHRTRSQLLGD